MYHVYTTGLNLTYGQPEHPIIVSNFEAQWSSSSKSCENLAGLGFPTHPRMPTPCHYQDDLKHF